MQAYTVENASGVITNHYLSDPGTPDYDSGISDGDLYAIRAARQHPETLELTSYKQSTVNKFLTNTPQNVRQLPLQPYYYYWYLNADISGGAAKILASYKRPSGSGFKLIASATNTRGVYQIPAGLSAWTYNGIPTDISSLSFCVINTTGSFLEFISGSVVIQAPLGAASGTISDGITTYAIAGAASLVVTYDSTAHHIIVTITGIGVFILTPGDTLTFTYSPTGTPDLLVNGNTYSFSGLELTFDYIAGYGITVSDGSTSILTETRQIIFDRTNYVMQYQFLWLNPYGVYDTYCFEGFWKRGGDRSNSVTERSKDWYETQDLNQRGYKDEAVDYSKPLEIHSDYLDDKTLYWLEEILETKELFLLQTSQDGTVFWNPMILLSGKIQIDSHLQNLKEITFKCLPANRIIT